MHACTQASALYAAYHPAPQRSSRYFEVADPHCLEEFVRERLRDIGLLT